MKKIFISLFVLSLFTSGSYAQTKATSKQLPLVFKMLQRPSYQKVMANVQAYTIQNAGQHKQAVKEPELIYTQLWDTANKAWVADTFEKYTIAFDANNNLQSITDISWDSVSNGAVAKGIETGFVKINEPVSIDNNLTVKYFPGSIVNQELQLGKWVNVIRELVSFGPGNVITSVIAQQWAQNSWTNYIKYDITYDSRGSFTGLEISTYAAGKWVLGQGIKVSLTRDANGNATSLLQSVSSGGAYVPEIKEDFQLDQKGAITAAMIYTYSSASTSWTKYDSLANITWLTFDPIIRIDYESLGTKGILGIGGDKYFGYTETKYDSSSQSWMVLERNIYTYNTDSLPTNIINQFWQNTKWVNNTSDSTVYYPGGDIKTYLPRYWSNGWYNTSLGNNNINTYDGDGDITECVAQNTDPFISTQFDNYSKTEYVYHSNSGIAETYHAAFSVYPNPVSSNLNIEFGPDAKQGIFSISDVTGRVVLSQTLANAGTQQVDVSSLNRGIYYLTINNGNAVSTSKFVKN